MRPTKNMTYPDVGLEAMDIVAAAMAPAPAPPPKPAGTAYGASATNLDAEHDARPFSPRAANLPPPPSTFPPPLPNSTHGPIPPTALPTIPAPVPPTSPKAKSMLRPPSPSVIRWAREQEEAEPRLPRGTAVPPASDQIERSVVERMQRRLLAAKRAGSESFIRDGGTHLDHPNLVYAAFNPVHPPEGLAGRPGMATSPRRLLSNRWDSAINYRVFDVRVANSGLVDDAATPRPPAASTPRDLPQPTWPPTRSTATATEDEPQSMSGLAGLLATLPAASPAAAGVAYKQQLVQDACLSYERPSRWSVR